MKSEDFEIRPAQVHTRKIKALEFGRAKVGPDLRVLPSPLVPRPCALAENVDMLHPTFPTLGYCRPIFGLSDGRSKAWRRELASKGASGVNTAEYGLWNSGRGCVLIRHGSRRTGAPGHRHLGQLEHDVATMAHECRDRRPARRHRARPLPAVPPAPGVPELPERDRGRGCGRQSRPRHPRQGSHTHPKVLRWLARHPPGPRRQGRSSPS